MLWRLLWLLLLPCLHAWQQCGMRKLRVLLGAMIQSGGWKWCYLQPEQEGLGPATQQRSNAATHNAVRCVVLA